MHKNLLLAVGITILFLGVAVEPLTQGIITEESEESFSLKSESQVLGDIIIVDDEGDGDYTTIKDALNHTNPGDTIEVYSGTYNEHTIVIETENIILEGISHELRNGSDTGKPFIDGPGTDPIDAVMHFMGHEERSTTEGYVDQARVLFKKYPFDWIKRTLKFPKIWKEESALKSKQRPKTSVSSGK